MDTIGRGQVKNNQSTDSGGLAILVESSPFVETEGNVVINSAGNGIHVGATAAYIPTQQNALDGETGFTANANVTLSADTGDKQQGTASLQAAVAAGFTTGYVFYKGEDLAATSEPWQQLWIKSDVALAAGVLQLRLSPDSDFSTQTTIYPLPRISANTWTQVRLYAEGFGINFLNGIHSWGLWATTDFGAATLRFDDYRLTRNFAGNRIAGNKVHKAAGSSGIAVGQLENGIVEGNSTEDAGSWTSVRKAYYVQFGSTITFTNNTAQFPQRAGGEAAQFLRVEDNSTVYEAGSSYSGVDTPFSIASGTVAHGLHAQRGTALPGTCKVGDYFFKTDATAGQNTYACTTTDTWSLQGDGGGAGGGDNVSVNGTAATDADFDNATPAAPTDGVNIRFQKDAGSPNNISANVPTSPNSSTILVGTGRTLTGGAGIAAIGDLSANRTIATASGEADFLASGALTCGASTQGKAQVHTTPLQYCDNAATPALQYAAYGASDGDALAGDSATSFFDTGTVEADRLPNLESLNGTLDVGSGGTGASTTATSGRYLKGDGSVWGTSSGSASGTGACTNQVVGTLNSDAAPTCVNISSAMITDGVVASADLATANKTFVKAVVMFASDGLADTDDIPSVFRFPAASTVTEVWCETDAGTPSVNFQRDDGTPANLLSANLTPTTTGATGTIDTNEDNFASEERLDFVMVSASTAKRISCMVKYTVD
ncbi:MAG: hypothetical protein HY313_00960 [Acidobacteria bacterium]|nr:hypothetical protein [Acidobacteriota bacterium]